MKMQTNELTGPALDWAVAKCEGHLDARRVVVDTHYMSGYEPVRWEPQLSTYYSSAYAPSTDWRIGGPIIERELIHMHGSLMLTGDPRWSTQKVREDKFGCFMGYGPTPLVAAMRCFVASKLGDEVEIPEELA